MAAQVPVGIRQHTEVPTSLLKAKRKFLGARPIINYQSFPFGRLFRRIAFVLMASHDERRFSTLSWKCDIATDVFLTRLIPLLSIIFSNPIRTLSAFSHPFPLIVFTMPFIGCFRGTKNYTRRHRQHDFHRLSQREGCTTSYFPGHQASPSRTSSSYSTR